jgi:hypothetical protein
MMRKLLISSAIIAFALTSCGGLAPAEAQGGHFGGGRFQGHFVHGERFHGRSFRGRPDFARDRLRFGGVFGDYYYPGYYGYGPCYRTIYGTIVCY